MQDALAVSAGLPVGDQKTNKTAAIPAGTAGEFRAALGQLTGFTEEADSQAGDGKPTNSMDKGGAELTEIPLSNDASFMGLTSFATHSGVDAATPASPDDLSVLVDPRNAADKPVVLSASSDLSDLSDEAAVAVAQNVQTANLYQVRWTKDDWSGAVQGASTTVVKTNATLPFRMTPPEVPSPAVQNDIAPEAGSSGPTAGAATGIELSMANLIASGTPLASPALATVAVQSKSLKTTTPTELRTEFHAAQTPGRASAEEAPVIVARVQPQVVEDVEAPKAPEPKSEIAARPAIADAPDTKIDVIEGQVKPGGESGSHLLSQTSRTLVAAVRENSGWSTFLSAPSVQQAQIVRPDSGVLKTLKIQLTPIELGKVELNLRMLDGQMKIEVTVENEQAYRVLSQDKDAILSTVNGLGFKVESLVFSNPQSDSSSQNQSTNNQATDRSDSGASGQSKQRSDRDDEKILARAATETNTDTDAGSDYDYI